MTDEHDTDERTVLTSSDPSVVDGVQEALNALGIDHDVCRVYEVRVDESTLAGREKLAERSREVREADSEDLTDLDDTDDQAIGHMAGQAPDDVEDEGNESEAESESSADSTTGDSGNGRGSGSEGSGSAQPSEGSSEGGSGNGSPENESSESSGGSADPSDGDAGNASGGHTTTDTISGGLATTGASSTTDSEPMSDEKREQLAEYPDGIFNLDNSEAGKVVYGAFANANREWVTTTELAIEDDDLPGNTPINTVTRHMWTGDILERRELEGRTVRRCTYEYRIRPGAQQEADDE